MTSPFDWMRAVEAAAAETEAEERPRRNWVVDPLSLPDVETVNVFAAIGKAVRGAKLYRRSDEVDKFKADKAAARKRRKNGEDD